MDKLLLFDRIVESARVNGLTLADIAAGLGVKTSSIYSFKTSYPSIEKIFKISIILDVSIDYLVGKTDNPVVNKKPLQYPEDMREILLYDLEFQEFLESCIEKAIKKSKNG